MARSIFLVTNALLAIVSPLAQAKNKNELRTYAFTSDDCNGPPIGGNEDIKLNKCHNIVTGANSIRAFHNKHEDWIGTINVGGQRCFINTYQYLGCQGTPTAVEELPHAISECISPDHKEPMLSILFGCSPAGPNPQFQDPQVITETRPVTLSTWVHTSNSLTTIVSSVLGTFTKTVLPTVTVMPASTVTMVAPPLVPVQTVTVQYPPISTNTVTVYVEDYGPSRMRRSDPQQGSVEKNTQDLEPRRKNKWKGPRIGVWMLHPWTMGVICYECYAKSADNTFKFECRSGPKNPIHCKGPVPDPQDTITVTHTPAVTVTAGEPITTVSVVTVTAPQPLPASPVVSPPVTTQGVYTMIGGKPVYTIIDQSMQTVTLGQKEADLEPRKSFHRAVRFTHPWFPETEMCADAEWDGRGKDRGEIRIQKPDMNMKRCDKDHQMQRIDASPQTSTYELPTRTIAISTSTVYPAPIVTVNPSPPMVTITTIIGSAPAPPMVTVTTIIDPAPAYSTITTITMDAEPSYSTVTVVPGVAPTSYTTIYQDRHQLRDL